MSRICEHPPSMHIVRNSFLYRFPYEITLLTYMGSSNHDLKAASTVIFSLGILGALQLEQYTHPLWELHHRRHQNS